MKKFQEKSQKKLIAFVGLFAAFGVFLIFNTYASTPNMIIEAESFVFPSKQTQAINPAGSKESKIWWTTTGTKDVSFSERMTKLEFIAKGSYCDGWPKAEITLDGTALVSQTIESSTYVTIPIPVSINPGQHKVSLSFVNDYARRSKTNPSKMECDRNLFADKIIFSGEERLDPATSMQDEALASLNASNFTYGSSGGAFNGTGIIWSNGTAQADLSLPGDTTIVIPALYGDACEGLPKVNITVDDKVVLSGAVSSKLATDYAVKTVVPKGKHTVKISLTNDYKTAACDRNIRFSKVDFRGQSYLDTVTSTQDELLKSIKPSDFIYNGAGVTSGDTGLIWSNGAAQATVSLDNDATVVVPSLYGDQCEGLPKVRVLIDDRAIMEGAIASTSPADYAVRTPIPKGTHTVKISLTNDYKTAACDRNIRFSKVDFRGTKTIPAPVAGNSIGIFNNKNLGAYRLVYSGEFATWRTKQTQETISLLKKIADQPASFWLGYSDDKTKITDALNESSKLNQTPVFVLYNIPNRDNGQYAGAGGGAKDTATYKAWIDMISGLIADKKAILILEPDALGHGINGLYRTESLQYATQKLATLKNTKTYIDATNSSWYGNDNAGITEMANRLKTVGVDRITGIALNTSNFQYTEKEIAFGNKLISLIGGNKKMVIDTSRNGNGPRPAPVTNTEKLEFANQKASGEYSWCNPPGRALGVKPTMQAGQTNVDAYLWIKIPGEIDGPCRGAVKDIGNFWISYGLEIARNAKW